MSGEADRQKRELERTRALNYEHAQLVGLAIGNPKKFPKFKEITKKKPRSNPEDLHAWLSARAQRSG